VRLAGRVAIITGAGQGIGRAIAIGYAREGAAVIVGDLDAAGAQATAEAITAHGGKAASVVVDVARSVDAQRLVDTAREGFGRLDILVNNAGIALKRDFLELTEDEWDRTLDVNLKGYFLCGQAAARAMVAAQRPGAIINLASAAIRGAPVGVHYSATKNGVVGITRSMAMALAEHRIRVNAIAPGLTDTAQPRHGNSDAEVRAMGEALPLGRIGTPEDIAGLAAFLASDKAAWITGQVYHINGGGYFA